MKKLLAILLVCVFAVSVVACGGGEESSAPGFTNSGDPSSKPAVESSEPAEESSEADVSVEDTSAETSDETSDETVETKGISQFMSWKNAYYNGGIVAVRATDATSLPLDKLDEELEAGETGIFTRAYGATIEAEGQDYADYAVAVFTYDHSKFGYVKSDFKAAGSAAADTAIPEDGWVAVIAKENTDKINAFESADGTVVFFPHGFVANTGLDTTISKADTVPTIDGKVAAGEYGDAIWEIDPENILFSYAQFEVNNYNATAKVYLTYDETNLYAAVVVDTPDHFNDCTPDNCGDMYDKTCIQVNVSSVAPTGEYMMSGKWDQSGGNTEAANAGIVRQYGFGVNNNGETLKTLWLKGANATDNSNTVNTREGQITTYEFMIPWADIGNADNAVVPEAGTEIGFSICINSGTETRAFQNLTMRDGGGIIGINDWTKMPTITLG